MSLVNTSIVNAIGVAVKVASALVINKILAVYLGPSGYAIVAQFQNIISIANSLAGGVIATGITKLTAQHYDQKIRQHDVWRTAVWIAFSSTLAVSVLLLTFNDVLVQLVFHSSSMGDIFFWLAIFLPAATANNILLAIVNGKKEVGVYVTTNIIGSLLSMLMTSVLVINFGLHGALVASAISPALLLFATAGLISCRDWFSFGVLRGRINIPVLQELSGFALMGLVSALLVPSSYILIRNHLSINLGLVEAGYWQAIWNISGIYLLLVTSTLSVYYLPRIAEIKTGTELRVEITKVYYFCMPLVIFSAITIFLFRDFIIKIALTGDFYPIRDLFFWQLIGDVIKIGSWLLAVVMLGRAMVKLFLIMEISFYILFVLLSCNFADIYGLPGVPIAYVISYLFYWICIFFLIKNKINRMEN